MHALLKQVEAKHAKKQVIDVRSGDTVRVHQRIKEGNKERVQVFEGLVIRTDNKSSLTSRITVRRIASGVGVEKGFLLHSPLVEKIEVVKRSKVRRKYLTYMRERSGKSARLSAVEFDKTSVNAVNNIKEEPEVPGEVEAPSAETEAPAEVAEETEPAEKVDETPTDEKPVEKPEN